MPVLLDFESRSRANLPKIGGRNYWAHPSTEALCCVWYDTDDGSAGVWTAATPGGRPPRGKQYAAHNAQGFDRFGAERLGWTTPDHVWIDTSELCLVQGWPGKLGKLGERYGLPKDLEASRFTIGLSTCRRPSGKRNPSAIPADEWSTYSDEDKRLLGVQAEITPAVLDRVVAYCARDVEIMTIAWPDLEPWIGLEPDVQRVDRIVNDRGVAFDRELAEALLECDARNTDEVINDVAAALGEAADDVRAAANSPAQFCEATGAPNAQAETVAGLLASGLPGEMGFELARARQALASIARGKLTAGLSHCSPDGRLRDSIWYYGGHTGRWTSKGMQLHNLPRPHKRYEDWTCEQIDALACAVRDRKQSASKEEVELLVRACLQASMCAMLAVQDFSGVEARALAWVSGDERALEVFASGKDPYKVMAAEIYGCSYDEVDKAQRQIGKIGVLACGYQMGGDHLHEQYGPQLDAAGISADDVVSKWRKLHAPSVKFWRDVEDAFLLAVDGHASTVSCFRFEPSSDGKDVAIFLPSGRPVVYPDARVRISTTKWGTEKPSICYAGGKTGTEWLYGGKITENVIQAMCRCLMADALVRADDAGLCPVLTVHDEIVTEVPEAYVVEAGAYLHEIMCTLPDWAKGFPVDASGFCGRRYRK